MQKQKDRFTAITETITLLVFAMIFILFICGIVCSAATGAAESDIGETIPAEQNKAYTAPVVNTAAVTEPTESEWVSLGEYRITHYCPCSKCNGKWANQTSSGAKPIAGRTIAVNPKTIPYGSEVMINDHVYVAEDTGGVVRRTKTIDILVDDHKTAWNLGVKYAEIWIKKT